VRDSLPALPERQEDYHSSGEEQPDDTDNNPAREELLAKDVARAKQWHRPQDYEAQRESDAEYACLFGSPVKLASFLRLRYRRPQSCSVALHLLGIEHCGVRDHVGIVAFGDGGHRDPVVLLGLERRKVCKQRDEDQWGAQRYDVADEHGCVCTGRFDRELASCGVSGTQPRSHRAAEPEDGRECRRSPGLEGVSFVYRWCGKEPRTYLILPNQCHGCWSDGRGYDDAHEQV
jgi:hypothetical protein